MKRMSLVFTLLLIFSFHTMVYSEYAPEWLKDQNSLPDYRKIFLLSGSLRVQKPIAQFRITNVTTGKTQDSYTGRDCNIPFPTIEAKVGDIIKFKDLSFCDIYNIKEWDWQYYGVEGSSNSIYKNNPLNGLEIKLTKSGTTTYYLAVMSDAETTNGIMPWSDNGNHQTVGPKTAMAPNGIFWYFTAITLKTSVAPTSTPKQTVTPTPTSKPKPVITPSPTVARSANIVASASVYYVSDPGVNSIKSGYGFRLEVDTDVVVSPKPKETDPKPTGAKKATAYFLGKAYPMEIKSSSGTAVSFYLPKDTSSVTNARKIYIPVNTPDGTYDIAIYIEGASYDGKPVSKTIHKSITIKGSMYEDDYTGPQG